MDELEFYNGALTGAEIDRRIIVVNCGTISSNSTTVNNANITSKHIVLNATFSTASMFLGAITVTTSNGSLTINGTFVQTGTLTLTLGIPL